MQGIWAALGRNRLVAAGAVVVAAVGALAIALLALGGGDDDSLAAPGSPIPSTATSTATATATVTPEASPTPIRHAAILDGMPMTDDEWARRKDLSPLAVMLDNTTGAYPHAGLDRADLVYEAFVEGGLTRFMAVYWRQDAEKILPVRSARTPFVVWVSELNALYGHAGGAITDNEANAVGQIFEWKIRDLNAFTPVSSNAYYRDADRRAPYNLATSTAHLREAAAALGLDGPAVVEPWKFREAGQPLPSGKPAGGIEVDFQGRLYSWQYIQWKWDGAKKRYLRFQFGGPHLDAVSGEQLGFATVIVMRVPGEVVDESGHVLLEQVGSGDATVFTGGQAFEGTWRKESRQGRTRFFDTSGAEIVFERGPIFIEVIGQQSRFGFVPAAGDLPPIPEYVPPPPGPAEEPDEPPATPEPGPTATSTPRAGTPQASPTRPAGTATAPAGSATPATSSTPASTATGTPEESPTSAAPSTIPESETPSPSAAAN